MVCLIGQRKEGFVCYFDLLWSIVSCIGLLSGIIMMIVSLNIYTTSSRGYEIDLQHTLNLSIPLSIDVEVLDRKCDGTIFIPLLIKNCLFIGMQINPCLPLKQMYMIFLLSTEDNKPHISRRVSIYRNSTALRCISLVSNLSIGWRWFPHNVRWSTIYATGSGCLSSSVFMCSTNIFYL